MNRIKYTLFVFASLLLISGAAFAQQNQKEAEANISQSLDKAMSDLEKLLEQKSWAGSKVQGRNLVGIIRSLNGYKKDNPNVDVQRALSLASIKMENQIKDKHYTWAIATLGEVRKALAIEPGSVSAPITNGDKLE